MDRELYGGREANHVFPSTIDELLDEVTWLLVEAAHPERIILFGSHARGNFDEDSDLDLLIILPTVVDRFEEMVRLRLILRDIPMPIDVIVYSRSDVEERQHLRGTMLCHALREGRMLSASATSVSCDSRMVLTEDIQGITGHPDHSAVTRAVIRAFDTLGGSAPLKL